MKKTRYISLHNFVLAHPAMKQAVIWGTKLLPGVVYVSYPAMLVYLLLTGGDLLRGILVPGAGFLLCTLLRAGINAPRPYEKLDLPSITPKETRGKSFPSRHAACGAVIAVTALGLCPPLGWVLLGVSLLIPLSRVLAGVHFIRDVICGWLLGALVGLLAL